MLSRGLLTLASIHLIVGTEGFRHRFAGHSSIRHHTPNTRNLIRIQQAQAGTEGDTPGRQDLSPNQVKLLRKEVSKRRARNKLAQTWVDDTATPFSDEILGTIVDLLGKHELVEVRGLSTKEKKKVFSSCLQLAFELSLSADRPIHLVEHKGHAGTFYCPGEMRDRIILRSSYKEGAWTKKPKALRDNRGQIIRED